MPTPKEQLILEAIRDRMKLINGTGGYSTNFNNRVEVWKGNWQADEGIAIGIFTGRTENQSSSRENANRRDAIHSMPVQIVAFLKTSEDDSVNVATAENAIADIKMAIRLDGTGPPFPPEQWGGNAMHTFEIAHTIGKDPDSFEILNVQVEVEVHYFTGKFNSYV